MLPLMLTFDSKREERKASKMPEISRFFGIIIAMFFDEHNPPQKIEPLR